MSKSPFPPLAGRTEYSYAEDGPMTMEQLDAWLPALKGGYARPGALQWLADSYRAAIDAGRKATAVYPDDHKWPGALIVHDEPERIRDIDEIVEKATS